MRKELLDATTFLKVFAPEEGSECVADVKWRESDVRAGICLRGDQQANAGGRPVVHVRI